MKKNQSLDSINSRNYPVRIEFDPEDSLYVADFIDLPGCSAHGSTVEEAYASAQEAKKEWLELAIKQGLQIPEPSMASEYSGRILLRLPSSLHGMVAERAKLHGASLNQYVVHLLSSAVVRDEMREDLATIEAGIAKMNWQMTKLSTDIGKLAVQAAYKPASVNTTVGTYPISGNVTTQNMNPGLYSSLVTYNIGFRNNFAVDLAGSFDPPMISSDQIISDVTQSSQRRP